MLTPYRVLDLTDERGHFAGAILAGLGADVIAVEPPGGSRARRLGPFVGGEPGGERSLTHFAYNRGKRSVVLDLAGSASDRKSLARLAAGADVLIESAGPGVLEGQGVSLEELRRANPALITASITPFGPDGPKSDWAATDLTVLASSNTLALTGDADRPPVRLVVPQAFLFAAAGAASGVMVALIERARSGLGQHVDVSAQCVAMLGVQGAVLSAGIGASVATRSAGGSKVGPVELRFVYPTADDGFVSITHVFGTAIGPATAALMRWVHEEGFCDEEMRDKDWVNYAVLLERGDEPLEAWEAAKAAVEAFTRSKTKAELLAGAGERRLLVTPIATPEDVVHNPHFEARGFFDLVHHPVTGEKVRAPGRPAVCSASPLPALGPAPLLGEHTGEVLAEPSRRPAVGRAAGPPGDGEGPGEALAGLKVLDFSWSVAAPHFVRILADHGATVVKVESVHKLDAARGFMPVHGNEPGAENSALFDDVNTGKLSLALNLTRPEAREVALDLVRWADVVVESFSPRAMKGWKLDYEHLREVNPSIVMLSTTLTGQDGPLAGFAGYGNLGAAMAGFYSLAGWPDRAPSGPYMAYTDYTSTHFMLLTLLAALDHRRRTGEGQWIDLAQAEAAMHFLAPAILDYTANGHVMERAGNADLDMAPHGVYPAAGEDRWVAIACAEDAQWAELCAEIGRPDLAGDPDLAGAAGRLARRAELDEAVAAWTAPLDVAEVEERLQQRGVPVHRVATSPDCLADPQLAHRRHFLDLEHPDRRCIVEYCRFTLSRTPARVERRAPLLGEHTFEVLSEILGYDVDRVADLAAAEALE